MSAVKSSELIAHLRSTLFAMLSETRARFEDGDAAAMERFLDSFGSPPSGAGYKYIPPAARAACSSVLQRDPEAGRRFLFAAVLEAMDRSLAAPRFQQLPARVLAHQLRHYERILVQSEQTIAVCQLENDLFLKEFGLAALRLYAGGSNLIDANAGIGRSIVWSNGLSDIPRRLALFIRLGGFRPYFDIHAHKFYMEEFNEEGRNECYRCCAELYAFHPEVLGMFAGSWFYDPALAAISPRLAYLREVPERGGAHVLFGCYDEGATRNALAKSATRRQLYEAGKYKPAAYTLVWPRARQLAWADRHAGKAGKGQP
ncbi:hypothetical protein [Massilia niastensis]|uniref:hypothetical protein n=1 Tax=Massilia niastensis TaxID=544911 RepID=UPI00039D7BE2|nr:hypothetical protein [Massilia niastensis]